MEKHIIFGIHLTDRFNNALKMQEIFTEFGCNIKTRLGIHEVTKDACATNGIVLLEMCGDETKINEAEARFMSVPGVELQKMVFTH